MKHSFAPNHDLEICPLLRRIQSCRWGRQTQPGKSVAITTSTNVTETFDYIKVSFDSVGRPVILGWLVCSKSRVRCLVTQYNIVGDIFTVYMTDLPVSLLPVEESVGSILCCVLL